jgi:PQQ enzyme repeat
MDRRKFLNRSLQAGMAGFLPLTLIKKDEVLSPPPSTMRDVLTRSYNNARTCTNNKETILNVDNLTNRGIRKLFSLNTPGDNCGCEAQPLIVSNFKIANGTTHDMAILATMSNAVFAYDANNGSLLWTAQLGNPIKSTNAIDSHNINDHWGILSTPCIDRTAKTMYCVVWSSPDGTVANASHSFHAISLLDGTSVRQPLSLTDVTYTPGNGLPVQHFSTIPRKQRSALLLTHINNHKTVFIGCGTISESDNRAQGWIIAVDLAAFKVSASFTTASRFSGGGIWQAGQGLSADSKGFIYCMTGNGAFDGKTDWGECFLKLKFTPATNIVESTLQVVDWWSPFSDAGREGLDPTLTHTKEGGDNLPANAGEFTDQDLGSGGPVCIEEFGIIAGAGKDGILYVTNMNNMGKTTNADFAHATGNYAKLKTPPQWFTFYPGNGISSSPDDITQFNKYYENLTHHQHSTPVLYDSPVHGKMLFTWGENGNLRAWTINADGSLNFLATGAEVASPNAPRTNNDHGGMPGGIISLSCNGKIENTGLLWALVPLTDANREHSPGILYCYDANNFTTYNDGSRGLKLLWSSATWNINFTHPKFNIPVVSGGKIYVPTYDARVDVYGLA